MTNQNTSVEAWYGQMLARGQQPLLFDYGPQVEIIVAGRRYDNAIDGELWDFKTTHREAVEAFLRGRGLWAHNVAGKDC